MRATFLLFAAIVAAFAMPACGNSSDSAQPDARSAASTSKSSAAQADPLEQRYVAQANTICHDTVRDARRVGRQFKARLGGATPDPVAIAAEGLIKPGMPVLEREGERFRQLDREAGNEALGRYVAIFDPIEALAHNLERASAKRDANAVRRIETLMLNLGADQRKIARELGLKRCDVDFVSVLTSAALG